MATQAAATIGRGIDPANDETHSPYRWIILIGLITAAILEVLDTTIVNVAMPQMAGNLGATPQEISWVATGYILSNVIVLPMTAWLSGHFGRKRYLTGSIIVFIVASFFCGTAGSLNQLIFWRIVQGAGGAALLSTCQATLREIFPREQQGTVQSIYTLGIIMAPTLGPTLGGWITDNYSWPWVFFVNLPIGIVSAAIVWLLLWDSPYQKRAQSVDWTGIGLLAVGLGTLQYVLEEGNKDDWFDSPMILRLSLLSAACIIGMLVWELHPKNKHPIVNFRVMKNRQLSAALLLFVSLGFGLYGGIFLFPLFAQNILHFTPTLTGWVLFPGGIATAVSAVVCGRALNGRQQLVSPKLLIFLGLSLFVASMWMMGHLTTQSGEPDVRWALIIRGLGLGFLFIPITISAFSTLKGAEIPEASALMNLMRQLGGSFGIAVLATYLTNHTVVHLQQLGSHLYVGNPLLEQRLQGIAAGLVQHGYSMADAKTAALSIIGRTVQVQASTMAFNDAFQLIGIFACIVSPAILLLKTGQAKPSAMAEAH